MHAIALTQPPRPRPLTLELQTKGLNKIRRLTGGGTDRELAERLRINAGYLSRVLTGKSKPGPRFIAGAINAFGLDCFEDLFAIVPDSDQSESVA